MTAPRQFAIVEYWGNTPPKHTHFHGTLPEVMEHVPDSKERNKWLTVMNDAEHAKGTLLAIRDRERAVSACEDAVQKREDAVAEREAALLMDSLRKFDSTLARFDTFEAERAKDPEDDLLDIPTEPRSPVAVEDD